MKHKNKITEENYREVVLKRAIITCWILLAICLVVKIFGGNFFNIVCKNERFIKFCEFIDNSVIMYIIYYVCFLFTSTMLLLISNSSIRLNSLKYCLFVLLTSLVWIIKLIFDLSNMYINVIIINVINFLLLYLLLILFSKSLWKPILCIIYDLILTILSVFIKNIGIYDVITDYFIITTIYLVDYYILLLTTALFLKLKHKRRN